MLNLLNQNWIGNWNSDWNSLKKMNRVIVRMTWFEDWRWDLWGDEKIGPELIESCLLELSCLIRFVLWDLDPEEGLENDVCSFAFVKSKTFLYLAVCVRRRGGSIYSLSNALSFIYSSPTFLEIPAQRFRRSLSLRSAGFLPFCDDAMTISLHFKRA